MFYSHTFLAKKGPLGTVWIAAHLQHKLRKSHVVVTDISSTVDCIMFPEVPIALRLSGHLLLGVVRIYSKKVDYLYHDCNEILSQMRTMFASVHVNLPEDADRATFQAITLPDTFQLDALEFDTQHLEESPDKHLKDLEQITLPDQVPVEGEYVAFLVNEDRFDHGFSNRIELVQFGQIGANQGKPDLSDSHANRSIRSDSPCEFGRFGRIELDHEESDLPDAVNLGFDSSPHAELPNLFAGAGPMNKEVLPQCGEVNNHNVDAILGEGNSVGSLHQRANANQTIGSPSPIEVGRVAVHNFGLDTTENPTIVGLENDILAPGGSIDSSAHKKGSVSLAIALPILGEKLLPLVMPENSPAIASLDAPVGQNLISSGGQSLGMGLPPSPPVQRQNAQRRRRKRFFDESIVLSNAEMRRRLEDTSKIVRKRQNNPSTTLDVWKFQKHVKNDHMFNEPLLCGMCSKLQDVYERAFPIAIMDVSSFNTIHEMDVEMDQAGHSGMQDQDLLEADVEKEQAMYNVVHDQDQPEPMQSTFERELTPIDAMASINTSLSKRTRITEPEMSSRSEVLASAERLDDIIETPSGNIEEPLAPELGLSTEVPGLHNSPEEDLFFLNAENTPSLSPSGCESRRFDSMSSRTRLVAQYFKDQFPMTQLSNNRSVYLSLNKILEGKSRKQCARMFFETLVLKSYDFIDVEQEEAYGDISVSVTQTLSKASL